MGCACSPSSVLAVAGRRAFGKRTPGSFRCGLCVVCLCVCPVTILSQGSAFPLALVPVPSLLAALGRGMAAPVKPGLVPVELKPGPVFGAPDFDILIAFQICNVASGTAQRFSSVVFGGGVKRRRHSESLHARAAMAAAGAFMHQDRHGGGHAHGTPGCLWVRCSGCSGAFLFKAYTRVQFFGGGNSFGNLTGEVPFFGLAKRCRLKNGGIPCEVRRPPAGSVTCFGRDL